MVAQTLAILAAAAAYESLPESDRGHSVQAMLQEETPDVFLAKATLQQYLSRVVRKDWNGVKRLTHPKALSAIRRAGEARHQLAPWANGDEHLTTFEFKGARSAGPGAVAVQVSEDRGTSTGDAGVYLLFKSRGSWLVGDKKPGAELSDISNQSVRLGYSGWVDHQALAQARRAERLSRKHR
jgi:hypothetical protein